MWVWWQRLSCSTEGCGIPITAPFSLSCRVSLGHWSPEKGGTEVTWGLEECPAFPDSFVLQECFLTSIPKTMLCTMRLRDHCQFSSQKGDDEVTLFSLQHLRRKKSLGTSQEGQSKDLWLTADRHTAEFNMVEWLAAGTTNEENVQFFFSWSLFS